MPTLHDATTAIQEARATKYAVDAVLDLLATPKHTTRKPLTFQDRMLDLERNIASSYWVRNAANELDQRDPVDAYRDAKILVE